MPWVFRKKIVAKRKIFSLYKNKISLWQESEAFEESGPEESDEDDEDLEVALLFATPPAATLQRRDSSLERPRQPLLRRSRRTASDGGSPLTGGLPYTGRPFCEYN